MKIIKSSEAGSVDSGDILIYIEPNEGLGVQVELSGKAAVMKQFGKYMEVVIRDTAGQFALEDVTIKAQDNGALDYVIRARMEGAISRCIL
jgi:citrate lyase subunit gamma (acyl carrier protein)